MTAAGIARNNVRLTVDFERRGSIVGVVRLYAEPEAIVIALNALRRLDCIGVGAARRDEIAAKLEQQLLEITLRHGFSRS